MARATARTLAALATSSRASATARPGSSRRARRAGAAGCRCQIVVQVQATYTPAATSQPASVPICQLPGTATSRPAQSPATTAMETRVAAEAPNARDGAASLPANHPSFQVLRTVLSLSR